MLQEINGAVCETTLTTTTNGLFGGSTGDFYYQTPTYYWNSYPVYVYEDKTKKAIEILKALQAEKQIKVQSVTKFIELVERIAGLL